MNRQNPIHRAVVTLGLVVVMFVGVEYWARNYWTPNHVEPRLFEAFSATYGYGFDTSEPLCRPELAELVCRPQQYREVARQRLKRPAPEGTYRIVTIGASTARGAGDYPRTVGVLLNRFCPSIHFEAINLAVVGYGSTRIRGMIGEALALEPSRVLIAPGGTNEDGDEKALAYRREINSGVWNVLLRSHAIVLGRKLMNFYIPGTAKLKPREKFETADPAEASKRRQALFRENVVAMLSELQEEGVPVTLVGRGRLHVQLLAGGAEYRTYLSSLRAPDTEFVSPLSTFAEHPLRPTLFRGDKIHYSQRGMMIFAGLLARSILRTDPRLIEQCEVAPQWSEWLDRDDPDDGSDDERFDQHTIEGLVCDRASDAECRRVSDGTPHRRTEEIVSCSAQGSVCRNGDQPDRRCDDYEVRFLCELDR
jgi:hypothetical protein